MTNPIEGMRPSEPAKGGRGARNPKTGEFEKEMSKVEGLEKVGEAELEKRRKRMLKTHAEEESKDSGAIKKPTPYRAEFYQQAGPETPSVSSTRFLATAQPSPSKDIVQALKPSMPALQPPAFSSRPPPSEVNPDLPNSDHFWERVDLPDESPQLVQLEENDSSDRRLRSPSNEEEKKTFKGHVGASTALAKGTGKKKEASLAETGRDGSIKGKMKEEKKEEDGLAPPKNKMQGEKQEEDGLTSPSFGIAQKQRRMMQLQPGKKEKGADQEIADPHSMYSWERSNGSLPPLAERGEEQKRRVRYGDEGEKIAALTVPDPLPAVCQQAAQSAMSAVPLFTNVNAAALFYQMVGTVIYLGELKSGISVTEVILNSANFRDSVFFGTKIAIEKYASAPDSFNIRFVGSPAAVRIFNANIATLSAAFASAYEEKKIRFRIGRFETEIAVHRPLIRRKDENGKEDIDQRTP
jgi:hypothetical protein